MLEKEATILKSVGGCDHVTMTRTFHPVGQGAFYSEVFTIDGEVEFVVVYDCGTESGAKTLSKTVSTFMEILPESHRTIDVLFLSHLHRDHINGLDALLTDVTIKKTVIPLLPEEVILLTRVKNALEDKWSVESNDSIINDLYYGGGRSGRFGKIVAIPPGSDDYGQHAWRPLGVKRTSDPIPISEDNPFWEYDPMNSIMGNDSRAIEFAKAIRAIDGVFDEYGQLDTSQLVRGKRTELRKAYSDAMKKANDNLYTLVVNSRPVYALIDDITLARNSRCLYTGDIDTRKNLGLLNRLLGRYPIDEIGVFQVPHHGSKENWQSAFLGKTPRDYVVSAGTDNSYHHPDFWAMEEIRDVPNNTLMIVTEKSKPWEKTYNIL